MQGELKLTREQRHYRPVLCANRRCRALLGYSKATPDDEPEEWVCSLCMTRRYFIVKSEYVPVEG